MKMKIMSDREVKIVSDDTDEIKSSVRLMIRKAFDLRNALQDKSLTDEKVNQFISIVISECLKVQDNNQEIILKINLNEKNKSPLKSVQDMPGWAK